MHTVSTAFSQSKLLSVFALCCFGLFHIDFHFGFRLLFPLSMNLLCSYSCEALKQIHRKLSRFSYSASYTI
jgi:hypothetical protein